MKKVIVTGYNGYIGIHLVRLLNEAGYNVVGIDTDFFGKDCEFFDPHPDIVKVKKDIRQIEEKDIEGAFAICHLAALSNDPIGELNQELTYDINYKASLRLAKLAKKAGVNRFVYSSSCSMYGISGGENALDETAPFSPITAYAKSKVYTEKELLPLSDKNFSITFLRNATAYGVSPKLRLDLVVNNLVGWAVTTRQIRIMSDGTPWRPLIHAEDIARAFVAVIEAPINTVNGVALNTGRNEDNHQVKDIAKLVGEVVPGCEVIITGEHGSDSRSYKVDFSKIQTELPGFKPHYDLKRGIEQLYEYYQRYDLNNEKFEGRYFTRLKQLNYLISNNKINKNLFWNTIW
ncbi:MAG TPA: NAD(P)-dependent oxidoreductase [Bacteroidales bacterium]|nr:NAD(P)-dependent oxidoreductase [Bacteroidales bacterium]